MEVENVFNEFLRVGKCCIFTDPPFGCRTEPLAYTLHALSRRFQTINKCLDILPIFWVFPYYMETYVTNSMPEMSMVDYKVDYTNHDTYHSGKNGRKFGSPVRLFTNVAQHLIELPSSENYRYCKQCKRWVSSENNHCDQCRCCSSKNGSTYVHCKLCETCTKPSYRHCNNCWRCTQVENHDCIKYQKELKCMICLHKGHNELNCTVWFDKCGKGEKEFSKLKAKIIKTKRRICFICFNKGHNERRCTHRLQLLDEISFLSQSYNKFSELNEINE